MGTIVKIADFYGDFEEAVKRFNPDMRKSRNPLDIISQYSIYDDKDTPYLLIASKSRERLNLRYNTLLAVVSDSFIKAEAVTREFQEKSGIKLRESPLELEDNLGCLEIPFELFKKYGDNGLVFVLRKYEKIDSGMPGLN